jgi:flagellar biogenesis protein FliO
MPAARRQPGLPGVPRRAVVWAALGLGILAATAAMGQPDTQPARSVYAGRPLGLTSGASADNRPAPADTGGSLWRWGLSLGGVVGLILLTRLVLKRFLGLEATLGGQVIEVLARQNLSARQQLALLQVGRRIVLVGSSGGQLATLATITDADEIAEIVARSRQRKLAAAASFRSLFGQAAGAYQAPAADVTPETPEGDERAARTSEPDEGALAEARAEVLGLLEKVRAMRGKA